MTLYFISTIILKILIPLLLHISSALCFKIFFASLFNFDINDLSLYLASSCKLFSQTSKSCFRILKLYSGVELFVKNFDFQLFLQNTIDSNCFIWSSLLVSKFLFKIKLFDTYSFIHSVNLIFALLATSLSVICNVDPSISAIYFAFLLSF